MIKEMEFGWLNNHTNIEKKFKYSVDSSIKNAILSALKDKLTFSVKDIKLLFPSQSPSGSYRLISNDQEYFMRISSRIGDYCLEKQLVEHLKKDNVSINDIIIGGIRLDWEGSRFRIDIREFLNGSYYQNENSKLISLLKEINAFHKSINNFSYKEKIKDNQLKITMGKRDLIDTILNCIDTNEYDIFNEHSSWVFSHQDWIGELLNNHNPNLLEMPDAQCIHGQIHPGNVIFAENKVVIFDLETSITTYAPWAWDYAWVLQRFCLDYGLENAKLVDKLEIIESYSNLKIDDLFRMAKIVVAENILSVFDYCINKKILVPQSELNKFYNHELKLKNVMEI
tara:strand:- start:3203 stop:4222 length:1020 start_codon:yes stop_codon:yes gene_type:complete